MDKQIIKQFFQPIEDTLPDDTDVLLWVLNPRDKTDHKSFFVQTAARAVEVLAQYAEWHCYWSVGLREHQERPRLYQQGVEADVKALLCLNLDIDIYNPRAHKKTNLPPDIDAARELLTASPLLPTYEVWSGYGLQALWFFKEPEPLDSVEERRIAKSVCRALTRVVEDAARKQGWELDHTFNLNRLLRVPGSQNWKDLDQAQDCTILHASGPRYSGLNDFLDVLPLERIDADISEEIHAQTAGLTVEAVTPELNPDLFIAAFENLPNFARTWNKQRRDLKDTSQSGYDMSLALQAFQAEWTPTDVLSLLLAFGRKYKRAPKSTAYYKFTINKALAFLADKRTEEDATKEYEKGCQEEEQAEEAATQHAREAEAQEASAALDREDPSILFDDIAVLLEFSRGGAYSLACRITKFTLLPWKEITYEFHVDTPGGNRRVCLTGKQLIDFPTVVSEFAPVVRHVAEVSRKVATPRWTRLVNRLFRIVEEEHDESLDPQDRLQDAIEQYKEEAATLDPRGEDGGEHSQLGPFLRARRPFVLDGQFYFSYSKFRDYALSVDRELQRYDISKGLKILGASSTRIRAPSPDRTQFRYYRCSISILNGEGGCGDA